MNWKDFFALKIWKIILFLIILILGLLAIRQPSSLCVGGPCTVPLSAKILNYFIPLLLPGTTNLFKDNGFFIEHKTIGYWDGIPQLIVHVGIDLLYWYLIVGLIYGLINYIKQKKEEN